MYGVFKAPELLSIVATLAPISGEILCISSTILKSADDMRLSAAAAVDSTTCRVSARSFSTCLRADGGCSDIESAEPRGVTIGRMSAALAERRTSMACVQAAVGQVEPRLLQCPASREIVFRASPNLRSGRGRVRWFAGENARAVQERNETI